MSQNEWVKIENDIATIGLSKEAATQFGEIVYVELPQIGSIAKNGEPIAVIESTKSASDIYSPIDGEVIEVNGALMTNMTLINEHPQDQGWIFKIKVKK